MIAAGFEVIYKFKVFEKTQSKTVIAETPDRAKEVFLKTFDGEEKQPRIVSVEETVVEL